MDFFFTHLRDKTPELRFPLVSEPLGRRQGAQRKGRGDDAAALDPLWSLHIKLFSAALALVALPTHGADTQGSGGGGGGGVKHWLVLTSVTEVNVTHVR